MSHAYARAKNFDDILLALFSGLTLLAFMVMTHSRPAAVSASRKPDTAALSHLMTKAAVPVETVVVSATPSAFALEQAMGPKQLMARWEPLIAEASRRFQLPASWIGAVMQMESGGRTMLGQDRPITSHAGAVGIMQVMPRTYEEMRARHGLGTDPYDPHDNVFAGAAYLRWLYGRYGFPAMFAAYNGGPGTLEGHLAGHGLPAETRNYLANISRTLGAGKSARQTRLAKFTRPDGSPVWINSHRVSGVRAANPGEYGARAQTVMHVDNDIQPVREDVATATQLLRDHGGRV